MAFQTGITTGHADLFAKLKTFLTTNAELVAANQNWEVVWSAAGLEEPENNTDILLRGPGLADQDQVYVGLRAVAQPTEDRYWIEARGATGPMASATTYYDHIDSQPMAVRMFTDSAPMQYWFVANGRRFVVVLKISTVFETLCAGLFLPYADPLSYPYPLFVGGSAGPAGQQASVPSWRSEATNHTHFTTPHGEQASNQFVGPTSWMLDPMGVWLRVQQAIGSGAAMMPSNTGGDNWNGADYNTNYYSPQHILANMIDAYGGGRLLTRFVLATTYPADQTYGTMDGIYKVAGIANAAENIIQADGIDHLVVQNAFRTNIFDYWALALE